MRHAATAGRAGHHRASALATRDQQPPQHVIDKLCEVAAKPDAHGYSQSRRASPPLRPSAVVWLLRSVASGSISIPKARWYVTMGSKEGLYTLSHAIHRARGVVVLAAQPQLPVIHTFGFTLSPARTQSRSCADDARR